MTRRLLEGTPEEILAFLKQTPFIGQRLRLEIVLGEEAENHPPAPPQATQTLAQMLEGKTGVVRFEPTDLSRNTGPKFAALLAEKAGRERRK